MNVPKKILIIRTDRIGDVVLSIPVVRNLRLAFPDSHIAFICRPYTKDVLEGNPDIDKVIIYDKYLKHKSIFSSIKFILMLRKEKFDWALVLHPTNRANLISFFANIPLRIGWDKNMGFLLNRRLPHLKQQGEKHELDYTLELLHKAGVPVKDKSLYFPLKSESSQFVTSLLKKRGVEENGLFIVIHPWASCISKRWPQEYFLELVGLLKKEFSCRIGLIASSAEEGFGDKIIHAHKDVIDLRDSLSLSQLGSLLKMASLFISNDSGPVHVAAAVGTPVISIFGRKDKGLSPLRWRPLGDNSEYLHKDAGCGVCFAHECVNGFVCLREIKPREVLSVARRLLWKDTSK